MCFTNTFLVSFKIPRLIVITIIDFMTKRESYVKYNL